MPNRLIHESSRQSETLAQLSDFGERLFWRLVTVADDYGRFNAAPMVVRAQCFAAMLDKVSNEQTAAGLAELAKIGAIQLYRVGGKQYGAFATWLTYQIQRAKKPKYPGPDDPQASAIICDQMIADANICFEPRSAPNTNTDSDTNTIPNPNTPDPKPLTAVTPTKQRALRAEPFSDFSEFWRLYPRKEGKQIAAQSWGKLSVEERRLAIEDVPKRAAANWAGREMQHVPHAATYLNQRRWLDEIEARARLPDPRPRLSAATQELMRMYSEAQERERNGSNQVAPEGEGLVVETTHRRVRED